MIFDLYRLPGGTEVKVDATAAKGEPAIRYEVTPVEGRRSFVIAERVAPSYLDTEYFKRRKELS